MTPELLVRVDRVEHRGGRTTRRRACFGLTGSDVHAAVAGDEGVTVRRLTVAEWRRDLLGLAQTPGRPDEAPRVLPWALVVGTGRALVEHRTDVYDELLSRDGAHVAATLHDLHRNTVGRLRAVAVAPGRRSVGWVSWVLSPDGWRALTPYVEQRQGPGQPMIRVEARRPEDLPQQVARWAAMVRR